jgi:hypothetical protein
MDDWTNTVSIVARAAHYIKFKVVCVSDGSDPANVLDLVAAAHTAKFSIQGVAMMAMKIVPGAGGAAPTTTVNVTITDEEDDQLFATTGASNTETSWHDLSTDIAMYPPVFGEFNIILNDIGNAADQVTLYFIGWTERPYGS